MQNAIVAAVLLAGGVMGTNIFADYTAAATLPLTECTTANSEFICSDAPAYNKTAFPDATAPTATWTTLKDLTQCFSMINPVTTPPTAPTDCDGATNCACHEWVKDATLIQAVSTDATEWTAYTTTVPKAKKCMFPFFIGEFPYLAGAKFPTTTAPAAPATDPAACQALCMAQADCELWTYTVAFTDTTGTFNCFLSTIGATNALRSGVAGDGTCGFLDDGSVPVTVSSTGAHLCSVATGRGVSGFKVCNDTVMDFTWQDTIANVPATTTTPAPADGTTEGAATDSTATTTATTTGTTGTTTLGTEPQTPSPAAAAPAVSGLLAALATGIALYATH